MTPTTTRPRFGLPDTDLSPLFDGWEAGAYDLPPAVTDAAAGVLELAAATAALRSAREAAMPGRDGPIALREAFELADDAWAQSVAALRRAEAGLGGLVGSMADAIIAEWLRPAHAAALDAVRAALPDLEGADLADFEAVARAGAAAGRGYIVVVEAAQRIRAVLAAREAVFRAQRLATGWRDVDGALRRDGVLRDTPLWPDPRIATLARGARVRVGPAHPLVRVAWLAGEGAGWLPTASEWEAALSAWLRDPARNGMPAGRVPMARAGYVTKGARPAR